MCKGDTAGEERTYRGAVQTTDTQDMVTHPVKHVAAWRKLLIIWNQIIFLQHLKTEKTAQNLLILIGVSRRVIKTRKKQTAVFH